MVFPARPSSPLPGVFGFLPASPVFDGFFAPRGFSVRLHGILSGFLPPKLFPEAVFLSVLKIYPDFRNPPLDLTDIGLVPSNFPGGFLSL